MAVREEEKSDVDITEEPYISVCAGVGGLDIGLRLALPTARCVCYVEREAFCIANLVDKMAQGWLDTAPIWTDIKTFDGKPWCGKIRGLIGGYPCQPFSIAGKRKGKQDKRHLWPEIEKLICEIRPDWCFFENVPGHLRLGFDQVLSFFARHRWNVIWTTLSATEVGAPHPRARLWILAYSNARVRMESWAKSIQNKDGFSSQAQSRRHKLEHGACCATWWDAEPELDRVVDGITEMVYERNAVIGNGVVPIQVAVAFCALVDFAREQIDKQIEKCPKTERR